MRFDDLTEEQKAKARSADSADELFALAELEGVELTDEQLESVAGGWSTDTCNDHEMITDL